jgi:hypothetical protein
VLKHAAIRDVQSIEPMIAPGKMARRFGDEVRGGLEVAF